MDKVNVLIVSRLDLRQGFLDKIAAVDPRISVKDGMGQLVAELRGKGKKGPLVDLLDNELKKVGGKRIILCSSSWSSERWWAFGVEEFPNIEAVQKLSLALHELNVWKYFENDSFLGIKM